MPTRTQPAANEPSLAAHDDPGQWLGPTALLDLGDAKLRMRVRALTQLCKSEREKALAIYGFVKRIPFAKLFKLRLRTPREVLAANRGDALDKAGLLVAMLRAADIPARIRWMQLPGGMLRGLISRMSSAARPVVEIHLGGRWLATDTYIFDASYMAAARARIAEQGWECGYGIHRDGAQIWNGAQDAFLVGDAIARDTLWRGNEALFHDPESFVRSAAWRSTHSPLASTVHWNLMVPSMGKVIREMRQEAFGNVPIRRLS